MTIWRQTLILLAAVLADSSSLWSAGPAIDRRGANQPILLGEFDAPQSAVNALQFVRDGNDKWRLFAAGQDKVVWQWAIRPESGGRSVSLDPLERVRWPIDRGFRGLIYALAAQSDESEPKLLAFGGDGEKSFPTAVFVSAIGSAERQHILNFANLIPQQQCVESLAFWPKQTRQLAVGYRSSEPGNACIAVWDLDNPAQPQAILKTNFDSIDFLSISPDGRQLVAGARQRTAVKLWSIEQFRPWKEGLSREIELPSHVTGLCWIDQQEFAVATYKHGVRRVRDAKPIAEMPGATEVIIRNHTRRRLTFSVTKGAKPVSSWNMGPNSKTVETTADGDQLSLREADSEVLAIPFSFSRGLHLEFDVRSASSGSGVELSVVTATRNLDCANGLLATIRDEYVLSKGQKETGKFRIRVACDSRQQLPVGLDDSAFEDTRCSLALSPDGQFLAATGWKWRTANQSLGQQAVQEIRLWKLDDGALVSVFPDRRLPPKGLAQIQRVEVSRSKPQSPFPDMVRFDWLARNSAIAGETDTKAESPSGFSLTAAEAMNDRVIDLNSSSAWSQHRNEVPQSWETRSEVDRFWLTQTTPTRKEIGPIPHLKWFSQEIWGGQEFTYKNRRYVAVAYPAGILIWDVERLRTGLGNPLRARTQALVRCFYGHVGRVNCLSASAEGDWLISGASDGSICLWSLQGIDQPFDGRKELGLELRQEAGRLFVKNVVEGLPAYFAGLQGDVPSRPGNEITGLSIFTPVNPDYFPKETRIPRDRWEQALRELTAEEQVYFEIREREGILGGRIHREPLWTLYPMLDGQWVLVTPTQVIGASSDEAMRRFGWHVNLSHEGQVELFPLDLFREKYDDAVSIYRSWQTHEPVVRSESLELPSIVEITGIRAGNEAVSATAELPQPVDLSVNLRVNQSANEEMQQLELWCNGTLIQKSKLSVTGEPIQRPLPWIVQKDVLRVGDRNTLVAVVRSRLSGLHGDISLTNRAVRSVQVAGTATPKLHFLGIGVTELQHETGFRNSETPIKPLEFSANDVCLLGETLAIRGQASGFDLGEFQYLVSAPPQGVDLKTGRVAKPTRDHVLKSLDRLCEIARPNDFVWIAISCHGFNDYSDRSKAYLVTQDTTPNLDNALTDTDLFEDRLYRLKAPALVLLDACHSGSALTGNTLRGLSGFGLGPEVLVSCKPNQFSFENPSLRFDHGRWYGMGAFTASLVEALRGDVLSVGQTGTRTMIPSRGSSLIDRNGDGYLSVEELGLYSAVRVPAIRRLAGANDLEALEPQQPDLLPSVAFPRNRIRFRIPQP